MAQFFKSVGEEKPLLLFLTLFLLFPVCSSLLFHPFVSHPWLVSFCMCIFLLICGRALVIVALLLLLLLLLSLLSLLPLLLLSCHLLSVVVSCSQELSVAVTVVVAVAAAVLLLLWWWWWGGGSCSCCWGCGCGCGCGFCWCCWRGDCCSYLSVVMFVVCCFVL